jgi:hypothetical protein
MLIMCIRQIFYKVNSFIFLQFLFIINAATAQQQIFFSPDKQIKASLDTFQGNWYLTGFCKNKQVIKVKVGGLGLGKRNNYLMKNG